MKFKFLYMFAAIIALIISSCNKQGTDDPVPSGSSSTTSGPSGSANTAKDIYVAGIDNNKAVYWKNGVEVLLPTIGHYSDINSISFNGNDMYITGTDSNNAVYWKNGMETVLNSSASSYTTGGSNGIAFYGNDVYMIGVDGYNAVYWKNGTEVVLAYGTQAKPYYPTTITFNSNDMYITGYSYNSSAAGGTNPYTSVYWKNGTETILNNFGNFNPIVSSLAFNGLNSYLIGTDGIPTGTFFGYPIGYSRAVYWENSTEVYLSSTASQTTSIVFNGNDMYITGWDDQSASYNAVPAHAVYWINGVEVFLTNNTSTSKANSIAFDSSDFYIAGTDAKNAVYWKNGSEVLLTNYSSAIGTSSSATAEARSITIKY